MRTLAPTVQLLGALFLAIVWIDNTNKHPENSQVSYICAPMMLILLNMLKQDWIAWSQQKAAEKKADELRAVTERKADELKEATEQKTNTLLQDHQRTATKVMQAVAATNAIRNDQINEVAQTLKVVEKQTNGDFHRMLGELATAVKELKDRMDANEKKPANPGS